MVSLYFIRHGEASSSWDQSSDPGLSDLGHQQAQAVCDELCTTIPPINLITSPLLRAQETAKPFTDKWKREPLIDPKIAEIPSTGIAFEDRRAWLTSLMRQDWTQQPAHLLAWRAHILQTVTSQQKDAIFFTHFMVLNVIVGALSKSEKIVSFKPDNCAITKVKLTEEGPLLVDRGREAVTVVR
jgi:broad specificity phosphatase PhoE